MFCLGEFVFDCREEIGGFRKRRPEFIFGQSVVVLDERTDSRSSVSQCFDECGCRCFG